ncbi:hypothetical protein MPER_09253 [Moniliophthora perniciosa FA553]|nr:hypothetical protein MPER_09253 [Moniliophthora perniciosa FA553]
MSTSESNYPSPPGTIADEKIQPSPDLSRAGHAQPLDGGFRAWSTVAGSWFLLFGTLGYLYSYGVYQGLRFQVVVQKTTFIVLQTTTRVSTFLPPTRVAFHGWEVCS